MYCVGVDIGGFYLKIGLIKDKTIIDKVSVRTKSAELINQVVETINVLLEKNNVSLKDLTHVGVGCPGLIKQGKVLSSVNLNLHNFNLQDQLSNAMGLKVYLRNDVDMAGLAEHRLGAGGNCKNMILLALGTGVGGAIIIDGKLYTGSHCAGELGHIPLFYNGKQCNCGQRGCLEQYVSCKALSDMAKEKIKEYKNTTIPLREDLVYASDLIVEYEKGDKCAIDIVDTFVGYLTAGVLAYCNVFSPDKIVIGGGITYAPKIIEMVSRKCAEMGFGYPENKEIQIVCAKLGNDAGILGSTVVAD